MGGPIGQFTRHPTRGGEQGDPLMPLLCALGLHISLTAVRERLLPSEKVFAFLDDVYVICAPHRVLDVHRILEEELQNHAQISLHHGKTQVWNRAGVPPRGMDILTRVAGKVNPEAIVWRGDASLPRGQQGVKILRVPVGQPEFVHSFLDEKRKNLLFCSNTFIPAVEDPLEQRAVWRGSWGGRGFPLEQAAAQVCREAGARVRTNTFVRDMDLEGVHVLDRRRLEVVADGLTLLHGAQLAIDTTLVSPLHWDGTARRTAADCNGAALKQARRLKETTCPELSGEGGRARLVVLAAEVGGRWSEETRQSARSDSTPDPPEPRQSGMAPKME